MTLTERIGLCSQLIERYQAEQIGLRQAVIGKPLTRQHFAADHEWAGYSQGWTDGRGILEQGEGL